MKNWKIGTRITAGFGIVIAIAMMLGVFALSLVGTIEKRSADVTDKALPGLYLVAQIQNGVQKNFAMLLTLAASKDRQEVARLTTALQNARAQNSNLLTEYEKTIVTDKGKELFGKVKAARSVYSTAVEAVLQLKRDAKDPEAVATLEGELRPANVKYVDAMTEVMAFRKSFSDEKERQSRKLSVPPAQASRSVWQPPC